MDSNNEMNTAYKAILDANVNRVKIDLKTFIEFVNYVVDRADKDYINNIDRFEPIDFIALDRELWDGFLNTDEIERSFLFSDTRAIRNVYNPIYDASREILEQEKYTVIYLNNYAIWLSTDNSSGFIKHKTHKNKYHSNKKSVAINTKQMLGIRAALSVLYNLNLQKVVSITERNLYIFGIDGLLTDYKLMVSHVTTEFGEWVYGEVEFSTEEEAIKFEPDIEFARLYTDEVSYKEISGLYIQEDIAKIFS